MEKRLKVSVIIPTIKGREEMLKRLISTIPREHEIIVVDDEDLLLAAKRNKGAIRSTGEYLFFIDDDNYLRDDDPINKMLESFARIVGVMGMTAAYDDNKNIIADGGSKRNYLTGFTKGLLTNKKLMDEYRYKTGKMCYQVDEVANAFMIHKDVFFGDTYGFDEVNFPIDLDEADLCKRIKDRGYLIVMNPRAICYHKSQTYNWIPNFRR